MAGKEKVLTILSWNMYLMHDDVETGHEMAPFISSMGYGADQYRQRIRKTVDILSTKEYEADIILLQEIESEKVLKDMLEAGLNRNGYRYFGLLENNSPITVGYISRYMPIETHIHSSLEDRPIMELVFSVSGERIHVFNLHARSRISGGYRSRREMFILLDQLMKDRSGHLAIAVGDFNDDPFISDIFCDPERSCSCVLPVVGEMERVDFGLYYTPTLDSAYKCRDSCYWQDFKTFDHVLLSDMAFDGRGYDFSFATLLIPPEGADADGIPIKYTPESGLGVSDHFALKTELKYNP